MFKKIKVSNFYSIGEEQELSMEINSKDILNESAIKMVNGEALNLVSCIIGANGSGKTTVLKALSFLFWFINNAYTKYKSEDKIPPQCHALWVHKPSSMEIEFFNDHVQYIYRIEFNRDKILNEKLLKQGNRKAVFELERSDSGVDLKTHSTLKINETDKKRFIDRANVPILSSLIDTGYLPEMIFFKNFQSNVDQRGNSHYFLSPMYISSKLHEDVQTREAVLQFSKQVDLGIDNFQFSEVTFYNKDETSEIKKPLLECLHKSGEKQFSLPIFEESNGTQHYFSLYLEIYPILKNGGVAIFDEIECGMHPAVVKKIVSLFESRETNPNGAQLIFSTHQHLLLNDRTKTQIFITEKNKKLETEVYRLNEVEGIRNDENYFTKYSTGAYGGIPHVNWLGD